MKEISIGYLSKRTGVSVPALRYYEDLGLIMSNRNRGGHRRYEKATIRRVSFVIAAKNFGFSLNRIKELLDILPQGRTPDAKDWKRLSAIFKADLDRKIAELERLREKLDGCIGCGCLSLKACQIFNTNDHAASGGSGPQFLALEQIAE